MKLIIITKRTLIRKFENSFVQLVNIFICFEAAFNDKSLAQFCKRLPSSFEVTSIDILNQIENMQFNSKYLIGFEEQPFRFR